MLLQNFFTVSPVRAPGQQCALIYLLILMLYKLFVCLFVCLPSSLSFLLILSSLLIYFLTYLSAHSNSVSSLKVVGGDQTCL